MAKERDATLADKSSRVRMDIFEGKLDQYDKDKRELFRAADDGLHREFKFDFLLPDPVFRRISPAEEDFLGKVWKLRRIRRATRGNVRFQV